MALPEDLQDADVGTRVDLGSWLDSLPYNDQGLIAAIAQDQSSGQVLMLAWMNREAIQSTLDDGYATYYSRSRQQFWRKGETSGHVQKLVSMHFDCDGDAILLQVEQSGPACHTYRPNCFYLQVDGQEVVVETEPVDVS